MIAVSDHRVIWFRYRMMDGQGLVLEDKLKSLPTCYLHGSGAILPELQQQLEGLFPGDHKRIVLRAASLPGDYSFDVIIDGVREAKGEEILLGYPLPGDAAEICGPDCDCFGLSPTPLKSRD